MITALRMFSFKHDRLMFWECCASKVLLRFHVASSNSLVANPGRAEFLSSYVPYRAIYKTLKIYLVSYLICRTLYQLESIAIF